MDYSIVQGSYISIESNITCNSYLASFNPSIFDRKLLILTTKIESFKTPQTLLNRMERSFATDLGCI